MPFLSKDEAWKSYNRRHHSWVVRPPATITLGSPGQQYLRRVRSTEDRLFSSEHQVLRNVYPVYGYGGKDDYPKENYTTDKQSGYTQDKSAPAPHPPGYYAYDEDDECKGDDRQFYAVSRQNRWKYLGLVNEPSFQQGKRLNDANRRMARMFWM